ncbi:MAG: hypothetical protein M1818_003170 [Claussenomyces sp. TS43310]|nr:MAG: hypothetical protein M1818_003170 [Claussenomyces sp. TS43310]
MGSLPRYSIVESSFKYYLQVSEMTVMCNGKRFRITISADNLEEAPSLKEKYVNYLHFMVTQGPNCSRVKGYNDWVLKPFIPLFRNVPSLLTRQTLTLQDYFLPRTVDYTLRAVGGELIPVPQKFADPERFEAGVKLSQEVCSPWISFHPSEVVICTRNPEEALSHTPRKVIVNGKTTYYFKECPGVHARLTQHELDTYKRIEDAGLGKQLRIPHLCGLVRDGNSGIVFGLLFFHIKCRSQTLRCAATLDAAKSLRMQWAKQVTHTVGVLHEAGIVWGHAGPDNVLVDVNEEAWIINFGGGFYGREIAGTMKGDLDGLAKILDYLNIDASSACD